MGKHSHAGEVGTVQVRTRSRVILIAAIAVAAALTALGLVKLWPEHRPRVTDPAAAFAAPGVTFPHADVLKVQKACKSSAQAGSSGEPEGDPSVTGSAPKCGQIMVRVRTGNEKGKKVTLPVAPELSRSGLSPGDSVELIQTPANHGQPASFGFFTVDRTTPLWWLAGLFVLVVALVARVRGLLALVGLIFGAGVLVKFMIPALLNGESGLGVALVGSSAIMIVVLYLAHGISLRTSTALAGTLLGVVLISLIGVIAVKAGRLTGVADETGSILSTFVGNINFQGLLTCAVIVAGLGVLNDVTITQASAVWELRAAAPELPRRGLFSSAMRIGRDHIASTIYTIVFAYAGTALAVLLLIYFYQRPLIELLSTEDIAEEATRTLAAAIGLVLAVPITTGIAVLVVSTKQPSRSRS